MSILSFYKPLTAFPLEIGPKIKEASDSSALDRPIGNLIENHILYLEREKLDSRRRYTSLRSKEQQLNRLAGRGVFAVEKRLGSRVFVRFAAYPVQNNILYRKYEIDGAHIGCSGSALHRG